MTKKTNFGPDFGPFGPDLGHQRVFAGFISTVVRHCFNLSFYAIYRKGNELNLRKCQKNPTNFRPIFGLFGLNLEPQTFSVDFTSTTS